MTGPPSMMTMRFRPASGRRRGCPRRPRRSARSASRASCTIVCMNPVVALRRALTVLAGREHADHRDVAAERDGLDAVLGLALAEREQRLAEPDHVLGDLDAEQLGGNEVPDLVQADRQGEADHHDDDAEDEEQHGFHAARLPPGSLEPAGRRLCAPVPQRCERAAGERRSVGGDQAVGLGARPALGERERLAGAARAPGRARRRRARRCRGCRGSRSRRRGTRRRPARSPR